MRQREPEFRVSAMKAFVSVTITAAGASLSIAASLIATSPGWTETNSTTGAQVVVVRATNACFTAAIRVTGFLVARRRLL